MKKLLLSLVLLMSAGIQASPADEARQDLKTKMFVWNNFPDDAGVTVALENQIPDIRVDELSDEDAVFVNQLGLEDAARVLGARNKDDRDTILFVERLHANQ